LLNDCAWYTGLVRAFFFRRGDMLDTSVGQMPKDDAGELAKHGYDALMTGGRKSSLSLMTTAIGLARCVLPDLARRSRAA
jgi:uncharacterized protein